VKFVRADHTFDVISLAGRVELRPARPEAGDFTDDLGSAFVDEVTVAA
jgi:hypothetical protein